MLFIFCIVTISTEEKQTDFLSFVEDQSVYVTSKNQKFQTVSHKLINSAFIIKNHNKFPKYNFATGY